MKRLVASALAGVSITALATGADPTSPEPKAMESFSIANNFNAVHLAAVKAAVPNQNSLCVLLTEMSQDTKTTKTTPLRVDPKRKLSVGGDYEGNDPRFLRVVDQLSRKFTAADQERARTEPVVYCARAPEPYMPSTY